MFTFFITEENGKVKLKSLKYKVSLIPSEGFEVPFSLTFSCKKKRVIGTMGEFVENLYSFKYSSNPHWH